MNDRLPAAETELPLDDQRVARWLLRNPDFFNRHRELLSHLKIPHESGAAVSLVERQLSVLREKAQHSERKLRELVNLARSNERLAHRIHQFALGLIQAQAQSLEVVLDRARDSLHNDFEAEFVVLRLLDADGRWRDRDLEVFVAAEDPGVALFEEFFDRRRAQSGRLTQAQREYLFGASHERVGSAALVPIFDGKQPQGLLALASTDAQRFHPAMGVLFLNHIGELLSNALQAHLRRP